MLIFIFISNNCIILCNHEDAHDHEHTEHVCYNIDIWGFEVTTVLLTNVLFIPG